MKPELPRPFPSDPGPVARLLGSAEAAGGPLALLGLTPSTYSESAVAAALARQIERLRQHPQAGTPEADEVVMALHAAAAQLLDPEMRPRVMAQWSETARGRSGPSPLPPWEMRRFRQEARAILARCGGFNERSLRKLALSARKYGLSVEHLSTVLPAVLAGAGAGALPNTLPARAFGGTSARGPAARTAKPMDGAAAAPRAREPEVAPLPEQMDPAVRLLRLGLILGGIALLALVLGLGGVWLLVKSLKGDQGSTGAGTSAANVAPERRTGGRGELFPSSADPGQSKGAGSPEPIAAESDADALVRDLVLSVEGLSINSAEAVARFEHAVGALGSCWGRLSPDKLAAAHDAVVEFVYRCARWPEVATRAGEAVSAGASALKPSGRPLAQEKVLPGVWSVGLLSRLSRERDLPAAARGVIEGALVAAVEGSASGGAGTFASGATAAAIAMPRLMVLKPSGPGVQAQVAPVETWKAWEQVVAVLCGSDASARSRLLTAGLETVLLDGPEPVPGSEAARVVAELAAQVGWRSGDDSRRRLVRWFDLAGITATDLHAVTEALAAKSAAEGVDVSMVLAMGADEPQRREMRDRYATAWGLQGGPEHDALVAEWAKVVAAQPGASAGESPVQHLARAVVLSRFNEAAGLLFVGESQAPGDLIRKADEPVKAALASAQAQPPWRSLGDGASDGSWAARYLAAERNIPARAALLTELGRVSGPLGPVDAEVLMTEALRGSPYQVRKSAQDLVARFGSAPAVLNAALEQAVTMPRTLENSDLVRRIALASLPSVKDPSWKVAVRRVLVERLLEVLAARGDSGVIDSLATLMGQSYQGRTFVGPVERAGPVPSEKASAEVAARAARLSWLRWAQAATPSGREPLGLEQIARRHAGRTELASGLVQEFAAEQAGLCELMAYVVVSEQPVASAQCAAVLERLSEARRSAEHVFTQILAGERAMAELWALRLGVEVQ